jgi:hypothetical protein
MKKLVFALCMVFGAVAVVNAQDSTTTTSPTDPTSTSQAPNSSMEDQGRVKIKSQELPDAVKSSLESQEYRGWLVNSAYEMDAASDQNAGTESTGNETSSDSTNVSGNTETGAYAKEIYIVELKNGAQTKTVRFDSDGNKLDDGDEMDNDQE